MGQLTKQFGKINVTLPSLPCVCVKWRWMACGWARPCWTAVRPARWRMPPGRQRRTRLLRPERGVCLRMARRLRPLPSLRLPLPKRR